MKATPVYSAFLLRLGIVLVSTALILSACSRKQDTTSGTDTAPASVQIGCLTPLTGDGATYGQATKRGVDLALHQLNDEAGQNRPKIEVIYEDDQMNPSKAVSAFKKLAEVDKVPVVIGAFGSSVTLAVAPAANQSKVVLFSASSTADAIADSGDYIFRNVPPNKGQGSTAADYCVQQLKLKKAAILKMDNDYGHSLAKAFTERLIERSGTIVVEETYAPDSRDFRAQLVKIQAASPEVVFFPGHYEPSAAILRQARELGMTAIFFGGDGSYSPKLLELAGPAAEGSYYTLMAVDFESSNPKVQSFVQHYRAAYNEAPDVYSAYAFDAAVLLGSLIQSGKRSAEDIRAALNPSQRFEGVTGPTSFDAKGEVAKPFAVYRVNSSSFVPVKSP